MRRTDRQVTSHDDILNILKRCDTIRLGMHDDDYPYVVSLSFGYEDLDGKVAIYFHGAKVGMKHSLLAKNNHVCVEASVFNGHCRIHKNGLTTQYESIIGFGKAKLIFDSEAERGIDLICANCGFEGHEYDPAQIEHINVYKIVLDKITGKRCAV